MTDKLQNKTPLDSFISELHSVKETAERLDKKVFGGENPEKGIAALVAGVQSVKKLIWVNLILIIGGIFFIGSWSERVETAIKDVIDLKLRDSKQETAIIIFKSEINNLKEDVKELKQQNKGG